MSSNPVTMFAITAISKLHDIKETKKQAKIEQQRYQDRIMRIAEQAKREEEDRIDKLRMSHASNRALQASGGFTLGSRSFLNIQDMVTKYAEKDISTIRLNASSDQNELSLNAMIAKSKRKNELFGGWASIVSSGVETKAKIDKA
tara:strand:- start:304 stop:738 length:435 start_codon:yes stop_codon:yes gene_type:complete